jgi:hypothetical protein
LRLHVRLGVVDIFDWNSPGTLAECPAKLTLFQLARGRRARRGR